MSLEMEYVDWRTSAPEVKRMFEREAQDGFYSKEAFIELLESLNPQISDEEEEKQFDIADASKQGKLSYDDFYTYFVDWARMEEESKEAATVTKAGLTSSSCYARFRPMAESGGHAKGEEGDYGLKEFDEEKSTITLTNRGRPTTFKFPRKVLCDCTQQQMYDTACVDMVNSMIMRQMDVMFLAYGQTGTGKTHTMFGPPDSLEPATCPADGVHPEWGIFPRVVEYTLSTIKSFSDTEMGSTLNTMVTLSAIEFYLGFGFDLLNKQAPIHVEDGRPLGLTERPVTTAKDTCEFLKEIYGNRQVRKTAMNSGSSRSHTALILKAYYCDSKDGDYLSTSFTLFDLAGAERVSKTGGKFVSPQEAFALAMKGKDLGVGGEGAIINWDLTCIMNEVERASDCAKKKLKYKVSTALTTPATQTIAACFDGRALMGLIVCLSQAPQNASETWFSCTMGEKLAGLKARVEPKKLQKIESAIKDLEGKIKKAQDNLKAKPKHKFVAVWTASIAAWSKELEILNTLKVYDPSKDQVSTFVRKKLGLFHNTEGKDDDEQRAVVREQFEAADTNKDRSLSLAELQALFSKIPNSQLQASHVEGLYKQIDVDNNGKITFDEFFNYLFPQK